MRMTKKHPYTLLFVEDEKKIRSAYVRLLENYFTKVVSAENGEEALELYQEERPDIIIADILMPKVDGLELIEKIRRSDYDTRVILMTAHSDKERLLKATELNISKYLIKPVKKRVLLESIELTVKQLEKIKGYVVSFSESCSYNLRSHSLLCRGVDIGLTKNESFFLSIIASDPDRFFSVEEISNLFFTRFNKDLSLNAIKALIKRLRKKVPCDFLENRFGYGYRLLRTHLENPHRR